ncbi:uncharacterized protein LOC129279694 [Lytechinus pictus]|uniref:uncharacterized protein LOC129279694 n=1 Tax=Lytechinus pictus TaxID=7653 RepID=UPI0030BA0891
MADNDEEHQHMRIFLWHVPRTISTALTKCLSFIDGMEVWFECFTYCHMAKEQYILFTGEDLPMEYEGNEETMKQAASTLGSVVGGKVEADRIMYGNIKTKMESSTSKYQLVKEGVVSLSDDKVWQYLPKGFKHVFLIRDPHTVFSSYRKALYNHLVSVGLRKGDAADEREFDLKKDDILVRNSNEYFSMMHSIWKSVRDSTDPDPIVINTDDLLANPVEVLQKFCHLTGLPYSDSLLHWDSAPDITKTWKVASDDTVEKAVHLYGTAVTSSQFLPPKPPISKDRLSPDALQFAKDSMHFFEEMNKFKI